MIGVYSLLERSGNKQTVQRPTGGAVLKVLDAIPAWTVLLLPGGCNLSVREDMVEDGKVIPH